MHSIEAPLHVHAKVIFPPTTDGEKWTLGLIQSSLDLKVANGYGQRIQHGSQSKWTWYVFYNIYIYIFFS